MAGFFTILRALARAVWRDVRTLRSVSGNNFFFFVLLVSYQQPESVFFFVLILVLLLLGPLSTDPLRKVPAERLAFWPLSPGQRLGLRMAAPLLTPLLWIALPFFFKAAAAPVAALLIALALVIQLAVGISSRGNAGRPARNILR